MTLRRYIDRKDYWVLKTLYSHWNIPVLPESMLSTYGLLVLDGAIPMGAAFLYRTDSLDLTLIEGTIVNKDASEEQRAQTIKLIYDGLFKEAASLGAKSVIGFGPAKSLAIIEASLELGCAQAPGRFVMIYKNLK